MRRRPAPPHDPAVAQRAHPRSPGSLMHQTPDPGVRGWFRRLSNFAYTVFAQSPARMALSVFVLVTMFFTVLLTMPFARADGTPTPLHDAMLAATSAVTVTGLTPVNVAEHWSTAGQVVILLGTQIGGMGIVTIAAFFAMTVSRRLGLRSRLLSNQSIATSRLGEVRTLLLTVVITTFAIEAIVAIILIPQMVDHTDSWGQGIWYGVFYSVTSFCNAGFSLSPEGLSAYTDYPLAIAAINLSVIVGALGFPVILALHRKIFYRGRLPLHTKLTIEVHLFLLFAGSVLIGIFEWNNPATLGQADGVAERMHLAFFASGQTRSGGFDLYSMDDQHGHTKLLMDALMFVGGGSGSTAGGIKVTTLAVLLLAIVAEARGAEHITARKREISAATIRIAVAVLLAGATIVLVASMILMAMTGETLDRVLFDVLSAANTVGLSNGLTASLPPAGKYVISALMFIGRLGTVTLASGLALRTRPTLYRYPEERPLIG